MTSILVKYCKKNAIRFKNTRLLDVVLLLSVAAGTVAEAASFDCNNAVTETEKAICNDEYISALDELMAATYKTSAVSIGWMSKEELVATQKKWITARNKCEQDIVCIQNLYKARLNIIATRSLDLSVGNKSTSFIYMGEPISGSCKNEAVLSSWGECVTWVPAGPEFMGTSVNGLMAFKYLYIGGNGHMCSMSGLATKVKDSWLYKEPGSTCQLSIEFNSNELSLNPTSDCNSYCGARARNGFEEVIKY